MKKFYFKMKALGLTQHSFSHHKSIEIFPDVQGQLTPQSLVRSRGISLFVFVALRPMSTAMVIAGRSVHLATLFPGQA